MKKIILCIGFLVLSSAVCFAQEVNFSGDLSTSWGVYAPGTEKAGNFSVGNTDFSGSLEVYSENGTAFIEGNVDYDFLSEELSFDLSEAYIDFSSTMWGIRAGQQKVVWGKADGINITNSVFPKDSSSLYNDDDSVAIKSLRLSFTGNSFTIDTFMIPFFTGTKLPLEDNNPLRNALVPQTVTVNQSGVSMELPVTIGSLSSPEFNLKNMEYGIKASGYFSFCDVSLYGFYGWDKTPVLNYQLNTSLHPVYNIEFPEGITINGDYKKLAMVGMDFAVPVGPVVLRNEAAFFMNREFQSSSEAIMSGYENSVKQNQIMALAGLDWMPSGWTITAQYYCDVLLNKSENAERTDAYEHGATLSISKNFLNDTLEFFVNSLVGLNNFDSAINAGGKYSLCDQIVLKFGGYAFLPGQDGKGTYGKYKDLSSFYIKAEYKW